MVVLILVGVFKMKAIKNSDDFMIAGRVLPWYILVGTLVATWIGSGSLFSGAGLGYRNGLASLWSSGGAWFGILLIYFISKRIRNFGKITVPDIFEIRYGPKAALLATLTTVLAYITIVSYQFKGGGKVLSMVTDGIISIENGILITALFAISYTVIAGMYSVVYTDVVNGVIITFGTIFALAFLTSKVGGVTEIFVTAQSFGKTQLFGNWHLEKIGNVSGPVLAISFFVPTMLLLMGDANMYQRIFSAKNGGSAKKAVFFWIFGVIILEIVISLLGLVGFVAAIKGFIPNLVMEAQIGLTDTRALIEARQSGSEWVIPAIAKFAGLPTFISLLLVSSMMAIIVSTADSFLLIPSTNITRDVYLKYLNKKADENHILMVSRICIIILGFIAFLLVNNFGTILHAAYTAYNIYGTSITPSLVAAFVWKRATNQGAIFSILSGTIITLIWTFVLPSWSGYNELNPFIREVTFPASLCSIFVLVIVSFLTPEPSVNSVSQFFNDSD